MCKYECEKEITLRKNNNTKHMNMNNKENYGYNQKTTTTKWTRLYCNKCDYSCETKKNLKKQKGQIHGSINKKPKQSMQFVWKKLNQMSELDINFKKENPN